MWTSGGLRAYYRGITLGLLGIVPYSAIDLGCFEGMKRAYRKARMKSDGCSYDDSEPGSLLPPHGPFL
jgi:solute carrier family 25 phosphate transporter 23/24/25/41